MKSKTPMLAALGRLAADLSSGMSLHEAWYSQPLSGGSHLARTINRIDLMIEDYGILLDCAQPDLEGKMEVRWRTHRSIPRHPFIVKWRRGHRLTSLWIPEVVAPEYLVVRRARGEDFRPTAALIADILRQIQRLIIKRQEILSASTPHTLKRSVAAWDSEVDDSTAVFHSIRRRVDADHDVQRLMKERLATHGVPLSHASHGGMCFRIEALCL